MIEKIISLLLAPLIFLSTMLPFFLGNRNEKTFNEPIPTDLHSVSDYVEYVKENGAPAYSTEVFVEQVEPFFDLLRVCSGRPLAEDEEKYLNAHIDEKLSMLCGYIADNTSLDLELLLSRVPNLNRPAEIAQEVFQFDAAAMRERVYELRDQAYDEDNLFLGGVLHLFAAYWSVISETYVYTVPYAENPDHLLLMMDITYADGAQDTISLDVIIDPETGLIYGRDSQSPLGLGFDVNVYDLMTFGTVDSWQRNLGFDLLYDVLGDISCITNIQTLRFKFDYADKEWLIQLWKGNYAMVSNGMELGLYNRPQGSVGTHYDAVSDEEMMPLAAKLYHGDELLIEKSFEEHWWLSAYKMSEVLYLPNTLTMEFSITFPNEEMLQCFAASVDGHTGSDVTYTVDGLTFNGVY